MHPVDQSSSRVIGNIQILRAFAASGVVILHSHATIFGVHTSFHGSALFFVTSGHLLSRIGDRSAAAFAVNRFWRIAPSYWLATALLLTLFNMWNYWPIEHVVFSALFIPHQSPAGLDPVLGVGWALNLEMYVYSIFTISILISRRLAPLIAGLTISAIYFAAPYISNNKAVLHYFSHKYIWFFVIGIGTWYLSEWLKNKFSGAKLPDATWPISIALYICITLFLGSKGYSVSQIYWSAIVSAPTLLLIGILSAHFGADLKPRGVLALGAASYACFLLHTIIIEFLRHRGIATSGTFLFTTGVLVVSWGFAIFWNRYVEKNMPRLPKRNVRIATQVS